jgi:predicted nucleic acid-binding protein
MKKLKLYLDTTVWNYTFADDSPQHQAETLEFFQRVRMGLYDVFYSEAVIFEVEAAPMPRRHLVEKLIEEISPTKLDPKREIKDLAEQYLKRAVLPKRSYVDALHIAFSTFYQMDALVSWNFRHLANMSRRNRVMAVNIENGYNFPVQLVTPLEVFGDEKN